MAHLPRWRSEHYTGAQLKQLMHAAHRREQYQALADYYAKQEKNLLQQADEEKLEWDRRSLSQMGIEAKSPRPADSARFLYESYLFRASEAASLSVKHGQNAEAASPAINQLHM